LLIECKAKVNVASSACDAMKQLEQEKFDVLVSDVGMPGEDGYSLIRRIRALSPVQGGSTPAIAVTAYARAEDRVKAMLAGFQNHVAKPVEPAELIAMIASVARDAKASRSRQ
jgi:CheY-like chemotaxis protein